MESFEVVVIGAGQSGPSAAVRFASAGRNVALVERRLLGGTCVNDGCIPTKTLVASARMAWSAREAERFGVRIGGPVSVDMRAVKARQDAVVQASRDSLQEWFGATPNLTVIHGEARLVGPGRLRVGERELEAALVIINTGCRATVPALYASVPHLTNTSMMEVDFLPDHLVIVGGSYIALEFAQMYRRFGSRVTVLEQGPRLAAREDDDVAAEIARILALEGIDLRLGVTVTAATATPGGVALQTSQGEIEGSHLLVATGRQPNTEALDPGAAGVQCDARGYVVVDDQLRTSAPGIYATGDVNGRGAFTHTSYNDYEILCANLLESGSRSVRDRIPIHGLYIDPPLGRVGMSEREARASGRRVLLGKRMMTQVGRAAERGETHGFIKILADADTRELLGAAILGINGDEVVHVLAAAMYGKTPYDVLSRAVFAHPTVSELLPTVLQDLRPL